MKRASWLNLVVGVWLLFSPAVLRFDAEVISANAVIFGFAAILVSAWSLAASQENLAPAWVNMGIGMWMFVSAWALDYETAAGLWNGLISGGLLVAFALTRASRPHAIRTRV